MSYQSSLCYAVLCRCTLLMHCFALPCCIIVITLHVARVSFSVHHRAVGRADTWTLIPPITYPVLFEDALTLSRPRSPFFPSCGYSASQPSQHRSSTLPQPLRSDSTWTGPMGGVSLRGRGFLPHSLKIGPACSRSRPDPTDQDQSSRTVRSIKSA